MEEVCNKTLRILIVEYDQSSALLEVSCQNDMPRLLKSLSFSSASLLTLLFLCFFLLLFLLLLSLLLLYRCEEECSEAVPNHMKLMSFSDLSRSRGGAFLARFGTLYREKKIICC